MFSNPALSEHRKKLVIEDAVVILKLTEIL